MIKTQIQLPDDLYNKVKQLAREKEISLAELCRRGLEYMLRVHPVHSAKTNKWQLPDPKSLGIPKIHFSLWRELAHDRSHPKDSRDDLL
jgi:hypothetical protein